MHFLLASSGRMSGNKAFVGALGGLELSVASRPICPPASVSALALPLSLLFLPLLRLPKQQIIEHKKLRFFGGGSAKDFKLNL